ncbi:MAG: hypothetical protein IT260_06170 [Saprospiraceae bacterium]|nr:hypothetical protein [Saprospiraceae bacterium]
MKTSLDAYLDLLQPWLAPELVAAPYQERLRQIGRSLPVLSLGCLECRLAPNDPQVDLNLCINPRLNEHRTLRDWPVSAGAMQENGSHLAMRQKIQSFCQRWSAPDFFLQNLLGELWEVYDIVDPGQAPVPWLYISFLPTALDQDPVLKAEIILQSLLLLDPALPPRTTQSFQDALCRIPASIRVSTVGIKNSDTGPFLRLYMEIATLPELLDILPVLGWPGNTAWLADQLADWVKPCTYLGITLDFDGHFQQRIGVECHFELERLAESLADFTRRLCEQGACSWEKREALLAWDGRFEASTGAAFWSWPDRVLEAAQALPSRVGIKRMNRYVKLVLEPGHPLLAKGYMFFHRPVHRDA